MSIATRLKKVEAAINAKDRFSPWDFSDLNIPELHRLRAIHVRLGPDGQEKEFDLSPDDQAFLADVRRRCLPPNYWRT